VSTEDLDVEVAPEQDAPEPEELDEETRARRDAALRHVRRFGDPVLRARALPVDAFDEHLEHELARMGELMEDALGIGLAATQLGVLHRAFVYRAFAEDELTALVNPVIEWSSEELECAPEGCLSLPGVHVDVERAVSVRVRAQDARGEPLQIEADGLRARVIQHEIDHLDGVLILDRVSREVRKEAMRALREALAGGDLAPARIERTAERGEAGPGAERAPERGEAGPGAERAPERGEAGPGAERAPERGEAAASSA